MLNDQMHNALDCVLVLSNRRERTLCNIGNRQTVVIFTSVQSARRFLEAGGLASKWHLARMTAQDAVESLLRAAREGATKAIIDPDFEADRFIALPLMVVIEELQQH